MPIKPKKESNDPEINLIEVNDFSNISPEDVFTFECELVTQKPELISTACADLGEGVFSINWQNWTAQGASGIGTYSVNDCEPNCADGTRIEAKVEVSLSNLLTDGTRYFLTEFTYRGGPDFPNQYPDTATWDLTEFYLLMNS